MRRMRLCSVSLSVVPGSHRDSEGLGFGAPNAVLHRFEVYERRNPSKMLKHLGRSHCHKDKITHPNTMSDCMI